MTDVLHDYSTPVLSEQPQIKTIEALIHGHWYPVDLLGTQVLHGRKVVSVAVKPVIAWTGQIITPKPFYGNLTYLEPLSETSEGFVLPENIRVNGVRLAVAQ